MSDTSSPEYSGGHSGDRSGEGRWLTYDELGRIRGIGRESAVKLVQRKRWRRVPGNDGVARALVPEDWLTPAKADTPEHSPEHSGEHFPVALAFETALAAIEAAHASEVAALREQIASGEQTKIGLQALVEQFAGAVRDSEEAARVERARLNAEIDRLRAEAREAVQAAEALPAQLATRQEGADATEAIRQAEAMVDSLREAHAGEVGALKAERHRLATQIDGFATRADQAEARTDSLRARVDVLQRDRDAARAEAQEAAMELRQAEAQQRARGLVARLRAAWRGE